MTIAISLKVHEGVVLAADSASTLVARTPTGQAGVINVYNNANKIFNLLKGLPIGAATWGIGAIGESSMGTLMKDLRQRFSGEDVSHPGWKLDPKRYAIEDVAERLREFVFEEHYVPAFRDWPEKPQLGFYITGYSPGVPLAEEYQIDIVQGECEPPRLIRELPETGVTWSGVTEPVTRLVLGFSERLPEVLVANFGLPADSIQQTVQIMRDQLNQQLVQASMPLKDAIDLAAFLANVAISYSAFAPGAPVIGGPLEIASISKHEGFRWIQRKYFYSEELNPPVTIGMAGSVFAPAPDVGASPGRPRPTASSAAKKVRGAKKSTGKASAKERS